MAEEIIQARLWTKVDTLDNWNNNPLLLGPGELALVTNGQGVPMNMKWGDKTERKRFSDLPFAIAYDQGQFVAVTGTVLPTSTSGVVRYSLVGEGTYTRSGQPNVVVPTGKMGIIVDDGTTWSLGSTVTLPTIQADGQVAAGDNRAVSGNTTFNALPKISTKRSLNQLFNKAVYFKDVSFTTTNVDTALTGAGTTPYYNIPSTDRPSFLSWTGLGSSSARRVAWMTGADGSGTLVNVNTVSASAATIPVPATANSFRFFFQRPEDGDVTGTFMLNFGSQIEYEPYEYIDQINGSPFLKESINTISYMYAVLNGTSPTVNPSNWYKACPVVQNSPTGDLFGNTGLGYDLSRNLFIVSEYRNTVSSRLLIFRNEDLVERNTSAPAISVPFRTIDLTQYMDHIQGCAWDFVDDTYLALGTLKGQATGTSNSVVVKVSPVGTLIDIFPLGTNLLVQVGMLDLLPNGNIIIKPNSGSTAYIFNRGYSLIDRKTLIGNEGLCVDKYTGDIWCADDNFTVKRYNKDYIEIGSFTYNTFTNESGGSNVEGMCILPNGGLVISADANLHGGTDLGNSLFFFDFLSTVNKRNYFYLPNGVGEYNNLKGEYIAEMILPGSPITGVVVQSNFTPKKAYRSGTTKASVASAAFSPTLASNTVFQTKLSI